MATDKIKPYGDDGWWDQFEDGQYASGRPVGPSSATPVSGARGSGGGEDPQRVFMELMQGRPITVESMQAIMPELQRRTGAFFVPNARGNAMDLVLPNGQFVDVVQAFEGPEGGRKLQWNVEPTFYNHQTGGWYYPGHPDGVTPGGMGSGARGYPGAFNGLPDGYTIGDVFNGGRYPLSPVMAPGLNKPFDAAFIPPTITDDPGYKFRESQAQKALERGAAAKGTLMTGGFAQDLAGYISDLASQEYSNAWNRDRQQYLDAFGIYRTNRQDIFDNLMRYASPGMTAAAGMANANSGYAGAAGGYATDQANAKAAGQTAQGNSWLDTLVAASELWPDDWSFGGGRSSSSSPSSNVGIA